MRVCVCVGEFLVPTSYSCRQVCSYEFTSRRVCMPARLHVDKFVYQRVCKSTSSHVDNFACQRLDLTPWSIYTLAFSRAFTV